MKDLDATLRRLGGDLIPARGASDRRSIQQSIYNLSIEIKISTWLQIVDQAI